MKEFPYGLARWILHGNFVKRKKNILNYPMCYFQYNSVNNKKGLCCIGCGQQFVFPVRCVSVHRESWPVWFTWRFRYLHISSRSCPSFLSTQTCQWRTCLFLFMAGLWCCASRGTFIHSEDWLLKVEVS